MARRVHRAPTISSFRSQHTALLGRGSRKGASKTTRKKVAVLRGQVRLYGSRRPKTEGKKPKVSKFMRKGE